MPVSREIHPLIDLGRHEGLLQPIDLHKPLATLSENAGEYRMVDAGHIGAVIDDPRDVASVVGLTLVLSILATLYPSWRAAKLDPVEALRYE